jgi:methyl-accepting chemotaxis protein
MFLAVLSPGVRLMRRFGLRARLAALAALMIFTMGMAGAAAAAAGLSAFAFMAWVSGALLVYLGAAFAAGLVTDLQRITDAASAMAQGNLRLALQVDGRDELSKLARVLDGMSWKLSAMVADVRTNSALVAQAGQSLAAGNRDLAGRTEQQAANLQETAASVQQLSATVQQNAGSAGVADGQAAGVRDAAEAGAGSMEQAVESVMAIQQNAQRMQEIVGVIDSLAFQTNILALNAAVEAARAGEHGRGFAVVAAEVRNLAQRSAGAAKEVRSLIDTAAAQVASSVGLIRAVDGSISQIVSGVRGVAANMSQISSASAEQSSGLKDISSAVAQLDEITQRNARMVERAVGQANHLEGRAATLSGSVSGFRLQQGTADEAFALVQKAIALRSARGGGEAFLKALTDASGGFHDRDMYVFALDAEGRYRAFGGNASKVGTSVHDIQGVDGAALLRAIVTQADDEPGWVEYGITNPATGVVQAKMSYVTRVDAYYVGCGVYKAVAQRQAA